MLFIKNNNQVACLYRIVTYTDIQNGIPGYEWEKLYYSPVQYVPEIPYFDTKDIVFSVKITKYNSNL